MALSRRVVVVLTLLLLHHSVSDVQQMRWCGKRLNPVQFAKSARFATEMMATCKEHLIAIRQIPQIAKESRKMCAVVRLCYAYAEDSAMKDESFRQAIFNCILRLVRGMETTMPELLQTSHTNFSAIIQNVKKCGAKHMPPDESYMLGMVSWFADFVSW